MRSILRSKFAFVLLAAALAGCTAPFTPKALKLASVAAVGEPLPSTNDPVAVPPVLQKSGRELYVTNCQSCHGEIGVSSIRNKTMGEMQGAASRVPQMAFAKSIPAEDLKSIEYALKDQGTNPFVCDGTQVISSSPLRRLTKDEYLRTLKDFFTAPDGQSDFASELQPKIQGVLPFLPSDENVQDFDNQTLAFSYDHVQYYVSIAGKIADAVIDADNGITPNKIFVLAKALYRNGGRNCLYELQDPACVTDTIAKLAERAFRRPAKPAELAALASIFEESKKLSPGNANVGGIGAVLHAVLTSPHFTHRPEIEGSVVPGQNVVYKLSGFEVASRLSYLILGSMPDDGLWKAAAAGKLDTAEGVQSETERLFTSPRAKETVREFYSQWLQTKYAARNLTAQEYNRGFDVEALKKEMIDEVNGVMDELIWTKKAGFKELMTSNASYMSGTELAKVYGVTAPATRPSFATLPDNRRGLLTRMALLKTGDSGTHPILRGVRIRKRILCETMKLPDPTEIPANELMLPPADGLTTTRDRVAHATSPTRCFSCHAKINAPGFALEQFDSLGRLRTQEAIFDAQGQFKTNLNIDARVRPNIESDGEAEIEGGAALGTAIANSRKGPACLTQQWYRFGQGQTPKTGDTCTLNGMYERLTKSDGSVLEMMKALTTSDSFRYKRD